MNRIVRRLLLCLLALGLFAPAAQAQQNPLIGVWSTQARGANGQYIGVYFWRFEPGGGFQHRMVLQGRPGAPGNTVDYVGRYAYAPQQGLLQLTYLDYEPKQVCSSGFCAPVPTGIPLNQLISTSVQFTSQMRMTTQDATGPMIWIRQPQ